MPAKPTKASSKPVKPVSKKERFLVLYKAPESGGNISVVCSAVGIARQSYYEWLDTDEEFAKAMYELKMEKCDEMEQQLYQRGYEKSDTALIYWLKNNHPNYKETPQVQVNTQVNNYTPILGGASIKNVPSNNSNT